MVLNIVITIKTVAAEVTTDEDIFQWQTLGFAFLQCIHSVYRAGVYFCIFSRYYARYGDAIKTNCFLNARCLTAIIKDTVRPIYRSSIRPAFMHRRLQGRYRSYISC